MPRRKPPHIHRNALIYSNEAKRTSIMRKRLLSCEPVTMLLIGLSPSSCWFRHKLQSINQTVTQSQRTCSSTLFTTTLNGESRCHRPCIPSCTSFAASANTIFAHALLMVKYSHIPRINCSFPKIFHNLQWWFNNLYPFHHLQRMFALPN